jgi:hypothetical protein
MASNQMLSGYLSIFLQIKHLQIFNPLWGFILYCIRIYSTYKLIS